ncbi:MAG: hypothetical protein MUP85_06405 [Candidatus Lokiarchaeota archaeon]|nr:hypothetical protein [Candidatus Lokiarchaeota archaeon]
MKTVLFSFLLLQLVFAQDYNSLSASGRKYVTEIQKYINFIAGDIKEVKNDYPATVREQISMPEIYNGIVRNKLLKISSYDFKQLINTRKQAYRENTFRVMKFRKEYDEAVLNRLKIDPELNVIRISTFEGLLNMVLKERCGNLVANLNIKPHIMKLKIIKITRDSYVGTDGYGLSRNNYEASIEDIIKSDNEHLVEGKLVFYSLNIWRKTKIDFEVGKSYLVSLDVVVTDKNEEKLALYMSEGNDGIIPIINGYVLDDYNEYEQGKITNWNYLKKKLLLSLEIRGEELK